MSPMLTLLNIGMLTCRKGSENVIFFVNWGYAEIGENKVLILADSAEKSEEIDIEGRGKHEAC